MRQRKPFNLLVSAKPLKLMKLQISLWHHYKKTLCNAHTSFPPTSKILQQPETPKNLQTSIQQHVPSCPVNSNPDINYSTAHYFLLVAREVRGRDKEVNGGGTRQNRPNTDYNKQGTSLS